MERPNHQALSTCQAHYSSGLIQVQTLRFGSEILVIAERVVLGKILQNVLSHEQISQNDVQPCSTHCELFEQFNVELVGNKCHPTNSFPPPQGCDPHSVKHHSRPQKLNRCANQTKYYLHLFPGVACLDICCKILQNPLHRSPW